MITTREEAEKLYQDLCNEPKPEREYGSDRNRKTLSAFLQNGAVKTLVAVGGYKLQIYHLAGLLVAIYPNASSAGRGERALWTGNPNRNYGRFDTILGKTYDMDSCPRYRLEESITLAIMAWESAKGNIDDFYKALGSRGSCAICGATLTDPLSQDRGIGPECIKRVYGREVIAKLQKRNMEKV